MTCAVSWCYRPARVQHDQWMVCNRHAALMDARETGDLTMPLISMTSSRELTRWQTRYDALIANFKTIRD